MTCSWRRLLRRGFLGLALAFVGCASPVFTTEPQEIGRSPTATVLPVRWVGWYAFVEVRIDGKGPYSMLLDTGTSFTLVSRRVAAAHPGGAVAPEDEGNLVDSGGRRLPANSGVIVDEMDLAGIRFSRFAAVVMDMDGVSDTFGMPVDGILGISLFTKGLLCIDYPAREIWHSEGSLPEPDGETVLPLVLDGGVPRVDLKWKGIPIRAVLDSGSNGGIELERWPPGAAFLAGPVPGRMSIAGGGVVGRDSCARVRGGLSLGSYRLVDPVLTVQSGPARIGATVLSRFRMTLDLANERVRLEGVAEEWRMGPFRGTGAAIRPVKGVYTVIDLVPGCPAERAGVRVGDRLLRAGEIPADAAHLDEVKGALECAAPSVLLLLRRDGKDLAIDVPVVDLVP